MRVPASSFDPPVGAPTGVARLQAMAAATGTAVSPDGRSGSPGYQRAAKDIEPSAPEPEPDRLPVVPVATAPLLPAYYPPLTEQRAVLDRPAPEAGDVVPAVPVQRDEAPADVRTRPPVPGSPLDDALRRIIGAV